MLPGPVDSALDLRGLVSLIDRHRFTSRISLADVVIQGSWNWHASHADLSPVGEVKGACGTAAYRPTKPPGRTPAGPAGVNFVPPPARFARQRHLRDNAARPRLFRQPVDGAGVGFAAAADCRRYGRPRGRGL